MEPKEHRVYTVDEINEKASGVVITLPTIVNRTTVFAIIMYGIFFGIPLVGAIIIAVLLHPTSMVGYAYTIIYMLITAFGLYMAVYIMFTRLVAREMKKNEVDDNKWD